MADRNELTVLVRMVRGHLEREAEAGRSDLLLAAARGATPRTLTEARRTVTMRTAKAMAGAGAPSHIDLFESPDPRDPTARGQAWVGDSLEQVAAEVRVCPKCTLSGSRKRAVPGNGTGSAGIVFVGEGPGAQEDEQGEPFVGAAGKLLDRVLEAMNVEGLIPGVTLDRATVFVTNVVKCRPPMNRVPLPQEIEACSPYLRRQLAVLGPRIICCLGKTAAEFLVGAKGSLGSMRGTVYRYGASKLLVTYHPAALLRNPAYKRPLWDDMQLLAREYQSD